MRPLNDFTKSLCAVRPASSTVGATFICFDKSALPCVTDERSCTPNELSLIHLLVKEALCVQDVSRAKSGSIFRHFSGQERKFDTGLGVVSKRVSELDAEALIQLNTQLTLARGDADEQRAAIRSASFGIGGLVHAIGIEVLGIKHGYS